MVATLIVRQTFWELAEEYSEEFHAPLRTRSFSDSHIRYVPDTTVTEAECGKHELWSDVSTTENCSSAGSSTDPTESRDECVTDDEQVCASPTPPVQEQQFACVMGPMGPMLVPMAQTSMMWGCVQDQSMLENRARALHDAAAKLKAEARIVTATAKKARCMAPPPGNLMVHTEKKVEPERTTVVLRNLPAHLCRSMLLTILDSAGFGNKYDFVYLPTDFRSMTVFGYAIVNFSNVEDAQAALEQLRGTMVDSQAMITEWSNSQQGFNVLVQRYRDSPVMHESMPEKYQPVILSNGAQQAFPAPTKVLQAPRKFTPTKE